MDYRRLAGQLFRYLWLIFALLVIVYALLIVAGRELLPVINRYQPNINAYLSEKTGMDFEIESFAGVLDGLTPLMDFHNIVVLGRDGQSTAVTINRLSAELNFISSASNRSPVWQALTAGSIQINLKEDEKGQWTLGGYPLGLGKGDANLDYLFRMLYYSRLLRIDQLTVDMSFYSGSRVKVFARDLQVENQGGFHRTTASIALSEKGENFASMIFEGKGDPAVAGDFVGRGYLHLQHINVADSPNTLVAAMLPGLKEKIGSVETDLDLSLWFDWKHNAVINGRGFLRAEEIRLPGLADSPPLEDVKADVIAWYSPGQDWGFRIQQLTAGLGREQIEPVDFQLRQRVGQYRGVLDLAINQVNVDFLTRILTNTKIPTAKAMEVLSSLQPAGKLRQIFLDLDFSGDKPEFKVRANLDNLAVKSWRGSPAARGINGYVEAGLHEGFVILDSPSGFAMHYTQAFSGFMPYGNTRGKVAWQWLPAQQRVLVTSNLIDVRGEEGQGKAFLHLDLPTVPGGNPQMYLMVGMRNSHTRFVDRYLPKVLNEGLTRWLGQAIGEGEIPEAGFIWRGSLVKNNNAGRSIQVYARLKNGAVDYQQGWPAAEAVTAGVVVNNTEMDLWVEHGSIAGEQVSDVGVNLRQVKTGPLLRVVGSVSTDVGKGLEVLSASPLQNLLAGVTSLDGRGPVDVDLDLRIPLSSNRAAEDYRVTVDLHKAALAIPGTAYMLQDIQGPIRYRTATGVTSEALAGTLWGNPVTATIASNDSSTRISASGTVGAVGLKALLGPKQHYVKGETPVQAELMIPRGPEPVSTLTLSSSLQGLEIDLPEPFPKQKDTALETQVVLGFASDGITVNGAAGDKLAIAGLIEGGVLTRGALHLLADSASLPEGDGLFVHGELGSVNWSLWQPVLNQELASNAGDFIPAAIYLDLQAKDLRLRTLSLGKTRFNGKLVKTQNWLFNIESELMGGDVVVSTTGAPIKFRLDYLKVPVIEDDGDGSPAGDAGGQQKNPRSSSQFSPMDIPEMDVSVDQLFYGEDLLGEIVFSTRKQQDGIVFRDIQGNLKNIQIKPQVVSEDGGDVEAAQLTWTRTGDVNNSFFSGTLEIEDIESVLAQWEVPAPFDSKVSTFYFNLGWEGQPWEFDAMALDGYLGIDFRDGRFNEATGAATNAFFKLVGLINFDTWLRRLRFDFSDFFSGGLSFDRVEGGLLFRQGLVDFDDPVVASMPGGKIRLLGTADLIYEQLDARLVATMPVGTNLPWVAGLLGGLPAAVGVFITSKLFKKQVDQLSSISYRVTGPMDDPKIEVEKIFSDPTKLSTIKEDSLKE